MKLPQKIIALLSGAALLSGSICAQSVSTDPVGYVTVDIPTGLSMLALPMQKSSVFSGVVTDVDGSTISADFGTLPAGFMYVQVLESSTALGAVASVGASTASSVEVSPALDVAVGDRIAVKPHFVLSDIAGTPEFSDGSTITVYTSAGTRESFEYVSAETLGAETGLWADGDFEDASDVAILPSEGFVFSSSSAALSKMVIAGAVSVDSIQTTFGGTFSIVGSLSPSGATMSTVFADLAIGSGVTFYSSDGSLSIVSSYEVVNSEDLGLEPGKTFVRDGEFLGDDDAVPVSAGVVVTPAAGSEGALLPPAYTSASN